MQRNCKHSQKSQAAGRANTNLHAARCKRWIHKCLHLLLYRISSSVDSAMGVASSIDSSIYSTMSTFVLRSIGAANFVNPVCALDDVWEGSWDRGIFQLYCSTSVSLHKPILQIKSGMGTYDLGPTSFRYSSNTCKIKVETSWYCTSLASNSGHQSTSYIYPRRFTRIEPYRSSAQTTFLRGRNSYSWVNPRGKPCKGSIDLRWDYGFLGPLGSLFEPWGGRRAKSDGSKVESTKI